MSKPDSLPAEQKPGERTFHCFVRLKGGWDTTWRQVVAKNMTEAMWKVMQLPDVSKVYEVSIVPGGVAT